MSALSQAVAAPFASSFDVESIRAEFPILQQLVHGKPLVYLDNAASAQKPLAVIEAVSDCYKRRYANIHRGVHYLSEQATAAYESARDKVRAFLNARYRREIIFTRGTTEAINLVAHSFARPRLQAGDTIVLTTLEHHSNIVPWQLICQQTGATLKVVPMTDTGELIMESYLAFLDEHPKMVAITHVSNVLGTINPVREMVAQAHERGIPVLVDGAQAVPHLTVDVQDLDCDFYAFSGHKLYGPSGIGALYGKVAHLEAMPPYQGGGDMILSVSFEKTDYAPLPHKFEAGTPNIAGTFGLGAAIDWVQSVGLDTIAAYEQALLNYATGQLAELDGVRLVGLAAHKAAVLSFVVDGIHPHDLGTILDREGIAIRAGHHCAQPLMQRLGLPATARASFGVYNTYTEIDAFVKALHKAKKLFS